MEKFTCKQDAIDWLDESVCDNYVNNYRFANVEIYEEVEAYERQQECGCCGSFDTVVMIGDEITMIGCNYGH